MKKLNEVIPSMTSMHETEPQQDLVRPQRVWVQLAELFGKAFYREHGSVPSNLWVQAVSRLSDQQIKRGLANLANDELAFPANLSQFVAACKRLPPVRYLGVPQLKDNRASGRMSYAEWKKKNGI